jgi:hypothetical protein
MHPSLLSNLELRSNLLSNEYQEEMRRVTVFELRDICERNPILRGIRPLTADQEREGDRSLFWGMRSVSMDDGDRHRTWAVRLLERLPGVVEVLEERPDLELAIECLCVAAQVADLGPSDQHAERAASLSKRIYAVLDRPEFRLTRELVNARVAEILGRQSSRHRVSSTEVRSGEGGEADGVSDRVAGLRVGV